MLQRCRHASVSVNGEVVGEIEQGLVVLLGVEDGDLPADADVLAAKVVDVRVFADHDGAMNVGIAAAGGSVLVVSQFTLLADTRRGRRPSFSRAAAPAHARPLVDRFSERVRSAGVVVAEGAFGADMVVEIVNEGPVTIVIDVADGRIVESPMPRISGSLGDASET